MGHSGAERTSTIQFSGLIQYRIVTDRQTDGQTYCGSVERFVIGVLGVTTHEDRSRTLIGREGIFPFSSRPLWPNSTVNARRESASVSVQYPSTEMNANSFSSLVLLKLQSLLVRRGTIYSVSQPPLVTLRFLKFFPKRLGIFNQFFTHLLHDHFYTRVQIFIQKNPPCGFLSLTKLCNTNRDHLAKFYISLEL